MWCRDLFQSKFTLMKLSTSFWFFSLISKVRECNNPTPLYGGDLCVGPPLETAYCVMNVTCPSELWKYNEWTWFEAFSYIHANIANSVNGGWTQWTDWSSCSLTCVGGSRTRTRYVTRTKGVRHVSTDCVEIAVNARIRHPSSTVYPVLVHHFNIRLVTMISLVLFVSITMIDYKSIQAWNIVFFHLNSNQWSLEHHVCSHLLIRIWTYRHRSI